tara:strand:- start:463 stop:1167 length:705 start_codon:yes stop_codon:yes gene_type:complete
MPKILIDGSWRFNKNVSINFDEHVKQSIPKYSFLQKNIARMCEYFIKKNCIVYDVGCSTGSTIVEIIKLKINFGFKIIGIDESPQMIKVAKTKLNNQYKKKIKFINKNFFHFKTSMKGNVVIASLITPFLDHKEKEIFFKKAYQLLNKNGALILIDNINTTSSTFQNIFANLYYDFKIDQGLSRSHILKKAKSLRAPMTISTYDEIIDYINQAGFSSYQTFYKIFNFIGLIIIK